MISFRRITESDILSGSFIISGQCSDTSNVQIGQVYITELKMTVINKELLSRYTLKDSVITPYYGLRLASSEYEYIALQLSDEEVKKGWVPLRSSAVF